MIIIESLLDVYDGDFELWKEKKYGIDFYHVSIEGYMGFEKISEAIDLYKLFLNELRKFLVKGRYKSAETSSDGMIYSKRGMRIYHHSECYWIHLDGYETTIIWDTYYYLKDVIKQLEEVENILKPYNRKG